MNFSSAATQQKISRLGKEIKVLDDDDSLTNKRKTQIK